MRNLTKPEKAADAVRGVNQIIAGLQIGEVGGERGAAFADARLGDHGRAVEQVLGTDERDLRVGKNNAAADQAADEICVGDRASHIGAFGQIRRCGFVRREPQLERHGVFAEDVGETFQFAVRRREESHAIPLLDHRFGFRHGHLQTAVKRERGPCGDVRSIRIKRQITDLYLFAAAQALLEFFPMEERRGGEMFRIRLLLDALPEALGCAADLFGFVEDDKRGLARGVRGEVG